MDAERERAHEAWRRAERIRRLSDRILGLGPFGLGLDAVLDWVPGAGTLYSAGAGGLLLFEGVQAKASTATLARMAAYLAADTATSSVPIAGWVVDALFPGHLMAARALQKDIERRHGRPGSGARRWRARVAPARRPNPWTRERAPPCAGTSSAVII